MYYTKTADDVLLELKTSATTGLSLNDASQKLITNGFNELPEPKKEPLILKFLSEFTDPLIILLIIASGISYFLGEGIDALAIIAIVIINAVIGFSQEYKAEKAIEALKKMSASFTKVLRDGEVHKIEAKKLVVGDIILLEAGDKVPADARLIECANLEVSEAVITGESVPVKKSLNVILQEGLALGDQKNMVFKDTSVVYGRARAIVTSTGAGTEVGKISTLLKEEETEQTPLQKEITKVGKSLSIAALLIIVVIFLTEIFFDGTDLKLAFLSSVSLAVAAIPEGLPAVITIVLAIGVTRLAAKKAIIRKLPAVETLGATTHILTDKTGTLTQNRMVVTDLYLSGNQEYKVDGQGYNPKGFFYNSSNVKVEPREHDNLYNLLKYGALCNDSTLTENKETNKWEIVGDITEGALVVTTEKAGISYKKLRDENKRIYEMPFSSITKIMATVHRTETGKALVVVKGAPEVIVTKCKMQEADRKQILEKVDYYASEGLRSLGFCTKEIDISEIDTLVNSDETKKESLEQKLISDLIFTGIMCQKDPLRLEVKDAVFEAQKAGITTVMVTGDHKLTAVSIAKELGIAKSAEDAMTGEEIAKLSQEEFEQIVITKRVFARVSPEQKLKLVKAFKKAKNIVAVTGDGVNDAPAIKAADIGISMGIEGTDVSKEASDMILQNDNYATIVAAIEEGRIVFDNLIKFITYLISCNISEIIIIFLSAVLRDPLPLLPIHLLWINLVTDGFPSLALGMEPGEKDIMKRAPRRISEGILNSKRWLIMALEGVTMGLAVFTAFKVSNHYFGIDVARTVTFLALNLAQLVHSLNSRSEKKSLFSIGVTGNKLLLGVFVVSIAAQFPVIYSVVGEKLFKAVDLNLAQLGIAFAAACVPFVVVEVLKVFRRMEKASA